jgi:long-chain fatty acid transport protein
MPADVRRRLILVLCAVFGSSCVATDAAAQGLIFAGAGAVNRSMAGASTAAAVDAAGAGYWNPATIRALPKNEVMFGAEMLYADTYLSSSGPGGSGSNFSNSGLPSLPTIAAVYHSESLPVTFGIGIYALMGGGVNFPQSADNPILNATGPVYASASALGIQPAVACQLTDRLTVGLGPIIASMSMGMNPAFFAPNGPGDFPIATPGRPFWGGGLAISPMRIRSPMSPLCSTSSYRRSIGSRSPSVADSS